MNRKFQFTVFIALLLIQAVGVGTFVISLIRFAMEDRWPTELEVVMLGVLMAGCLIIYLLTVMVGKPLFDDMIASRAQPIIVDNELQALFRRLQVKTNRPLTEWETR